MQGFAFAASCPLCRAIWRWVAISGACLAGLSACHTEHTVAGPYAAPPTSSIVASGHYVIRPDLSDIRFLVFRAGALAALGHNHVIQAGGLAGTLTIANDLPQSQLMLTIPLADLRVDDPAARAAEGPEFDTQPDAEAIAGTARNMLGAKVLDTAHHPLLEIQSVAVAGSSATPDVTVRITLHGVQREITVPVALSNRDKQLTASARFDIQQSDFGITPLSVLGGALQVADKVQVKLHLVAQKN